MVVRYDHVRHISTGRFGTTDVVRRSSAGGGGGWRSGMSAGTAGLAVLKTLGLARLGAAGARGVEEEVVALARLRHPHLAEILEAFQEGGVLCVVSEYADAGNVAARIDRSRREGRLVDPDLVARWLAQAALALKYVHDSGALHRDLRARRLLLRSDGVLLVSGLATSPILAASIGPERPDIEALRYLSPELLAGRGEHAAASDAWALGIVLFELLALRPPYDDENPRALAERIIAAAGAPLPLMPWAQEDVQWLCFAMLSADPSARPLPADVLREGFVQEQLRGLLRRERQPAKTATARAAAASAPPWEPLPFAMALPKLGLGPHLLAAPRPTPRSLRQVCETSGRRTARELPVPHAALRKRCPTAFDGRPYSTPSVVVDAASEIFGDAGRASTGDGGWRTSSSAGTSALAADLARLCLDGCARGCGGDAAAIAEADPGRPPRTA